MWHKPAPRLVAMQALARLGPAAREALPALEYVVPDLPEDAFATPYGYAVRSAIEKIGR